MPLHYELQSGDIVEILTSKRERGPSRDWLALVKTTRARNKISAWFKAESREDSEHTGRELLQEHLNKAGLPAQKLTGSPLLADVIREMGFKKADDFYIALGGAKISPKVVVNKVLQRLKQGEAGVEEPAAAEDLLAPPQGARAAATGRRRVEVRHPRRGRRRRPAAAGQVLPPGVRATRSSATSRSAAASRSTATTARTSAALRKDPERFVPVSWDGDNETGFKVEIRNNATEPVSCRNIEGREPEERSRGSQASTTLIPSAPRWSRTRPSSLVPYPRPRRAASTAIHRISAPRVISWRLSRSRQPHRGCVKVRQGGNQDRSGSG